MDTSANIQNVIRHVLHTKRGCDFDRTLLIARRSSFSDGERQKISNRMEEARNMPEEKRDLFKHDRGFVIADHQVSTTNEMLVNGHSAWPGTHP